MEDDEIDRKDSVTFGSASKGIMFKCYLDFEKDPPEVIQKKLETMFQTREWMIKKGYPA